MIVDSEHRDLLKKKIEAQIDLQVRGILEGQFDSLAAFERIRGVIIGLGMAIDILEDKPQTGTQPEDNQNDNSTEQG